MVAHRRTSDQCGVQAWSGWLSASSTAARHPHTRRYPAGQSENVRHRKSRWVILPVTHFADSRVFHSKRAKAIDHCGAPAVTSESGSVSALTRPADRRRRCARRTPAAPAGPRLLPLLNCGTAASNGHRCCARPRPQSGQTLARYHSMMQLHVLCSADFGIVVMRIGLLPAAQRPRPPLPPAAPSPQPLCGRTLTMLETFRGLPSVCDLRSRQMHPNVAIRQAADARPMRNHCCEYECKTLVSSSVTAHACTDGPGGHGPHRLPRPPPQPAPAGPRPA